MECANCRTQNRNGVQFCERCGTKLERRCPACSATVPPDAAFCGACGQNLAADAPADAPIEAPAAASVFAAENPRSYTPAHLAERILSSRAVLEGERKQVTVLFADICGSLEMIEGTDPEHAQQILDTAVQVMMDAVHRYEGTVNKVLGDGIMALFGAPIAHEDHAIRAAFAALTLQREMQSVATEVRRKHGVEVRARVGFHSGEVVVRTIGNDLSMDYDAIGPTVHLASRMEQLAAPGTVRLTADTLRLAEGFIEVLALGPVPVKGIEAPIEVYELTGTGPARTRLQVAAARGLSRFVGRKAEMERLAEALSRAGDGKGQIAAVVGEPGVGKSRLFYEFVRSRHAAAWLTLESASVSWGKADPWHPIVELLKAYFDIDGEEDPRRIAERVAGKLVMLDEALKPMLPPLFALLGVPVEDAQWHALGEAERRDRSLDAVKGLLLRESQARPVIIIFEDLHWIDEATQALLDGLVESLPVSRILLLVNYRPEYKHDWGGRTYYNQLRIDPLGREGAKDLATALIGGDPGLSDLQEMLIKRTEGNPLFLEESVRTLVETGALEGEPGAYRLIGQVAAIEMPVTVQAILAARIDRLAPNTKSVLQCAAIIGHHVLLHVLNAVAETEDGDLKQCLVDLQTAEFLYEARLFPELMYTFKHALTHEVVYNGVLQDRRKLLHRNVGIALEELYPDHLRQMMWVLHSHYERAEAWDRSAKLQLKF
jgi:class 3 adenylate cyclase